MVIEMLPDARKLKILGAIVEAYIETGEPVGSKAIVAREDFGCSSATIRNEMAALAEMGLIEQPHTSAGRVPTPLGFRLYIDHLMARKRLSDRERAMLDSLFAVRDPDPDQLIRDAGNLIAEITRCASISAAASSVEAEILKAEVVPLGRRSALVLVASSSGVVKNRTCRTDFDITDSLIEKVTAFLQDQVVGRRLSEITLPALQTMATRADAGTAMTLFPLLRIVFELAREIGDGELYLGGQQNLLSYRELGSSAHELLKLLTDREELLGILSAFGRGVHVALGDELSDPLGDTSLIVSRYPIGRRGTGMVAVLGPIRVNYASIIANLEYFSDRLAGLLAETAEED